MRVADLPANADLGFTDSLRAGVGRAVGGRVGDLACTTTGASRIVTIAPGVVWVKDNAGTFTAIAGSLLRQVLAAPTTVTLAANADPANPRVDIIVAVPAAAWGGAPTIAVRQGAATAAATARNLLGAAALQASDTPLLAIAVPAASANLPAVGALVSTGVAEDCRVLAGDLTPAGAENNFAGATPPVGYKLEDGGDYSGRADGPWAELVAAIGTSHGVPAAGRINLPNAIGRARIGSGPGGTADDRGAALTNRGVGAKVGREAHPLAAAENGPHEHGVPFGDINFTGAGAWTLQYSSSNPPLGYVQTPTSTSGNGTPHPNMQPSIATPAIVKF